MFYWELVGNTERKGLKKQGRTKRRVQQNQVLEILIPGFFDPKRGIKKQLGGKKWEGQPMVLTSLQVPPVLKACFLAVLPISLEQPLRRVRAHRHVSLPFSMKKKSFQPPARFPEMRSLNLFPFTCFPLMSKSPCICSDLTSCLCNVTLVLVYLFNVKFLSVGAEQCSPSLHSSNCATVYFLILTSHFFRKVLIHEAKKGKS